MTRKAGRWWLMTGGLGALLFYVAALLLQLLVFHSVGSLLWPPFMLLLLLIGAVLAAASEGLFRLAGSRAWGIGLSSALIPLAVVGVTTVMTASGPRTIIHWHTFWPIWLWVLVFVLGYWAARSLLKRSYGLDW